MQYDSDYEVRLAELEALGGDVSKNYDSVYDIDLAILEKIAGGIGGDVIDDNSPSSLTTTFSASSITSYIDELRNAILAKQNILTAGENIIIQNDVISATGGGGGGNVNSVTWSELKTLRDNSQLVVGDEYRITDYVFTTTAARSRSRNFQYDIIVKAEKSNVLSDWGRAALHEGIVNDPLLNWHVDKWRLKYSLDNDKDRFDWADPDNGKGVVYRLNDAYNNSYPCDFYNVEQQDDGDNWKAMFNSFPNAYTQVYNYNTYVEDDFVYGTNPDTYVPNKMKYYLPRLLAREIRNSYIGCSVIIEEKHKYHPITIENSYIGRNSVIRHNVSKSIIGERCIVGNVLCQGNLTNCIVLSESNINESDSSGNNNFTNCIMQGVIKGLWITSNCILKGYIRTTNTYTMLSNSIIMGSVNLNAYLSNLVFIGNGTVSYEITTGNQNYGNGCFISSIHDLNYEIPARKNTETSVVFGKVATGVIVNDASIYSMKIGTDLYKDPNPSISITGSTALDVTDIVTNQDSATYVITYPNGGNSPDFGDTTIVVTAPDTTTTKTYTITQIQG